MIRVKLRGHDFRYEAYQIISLFYSKEDIVFTDDGNDMESIFDKESSSIECVIYKGMGESIKRIIKVNPENKKDIKNAIKMTILGCLEEHIGVKIPWGILVGIRPTKIVHEYIKKGFDDEAIMGEIISKYSLSNEKAKLAVEVAHNEERFLTTRGKGLSLYIGIPFCPTRCIYCSFTSNPVKGNSNLVEEYLNCLTKEINITLQHIKKTGFYIDTLYMGGGTPTALSASQMERLLNTVGSHLNSDDIREITIEAGRPDSIDMDKLSVIKDFGCKRISINPQSMNDETLKRIGRMHSVNDVIEKYNMARSVGFDSINMDIIIGLPGEGEEEVKRTMASLERLSPENITIHTMAVKRASILNEKEHNIRSSKAASMYEIATSSAREMGMYPYYMYRQKNMVSPLENVGYCMKDKECIYNIQMIGENISIISFGADAVTKMVFPEENRIERVANLKDVREYINRIDEMIENKINAINMLTK